MIDLPREAVDEFNVIYEKEFGEKLSDGEAKFRAENFLSLMRLISKPEVESEK